MKPGKQREQRDRLQMRFAELMAAFITLGWSAKQLSCVLDELTKKMQKALESEEVRDD